MAKIKWCVSGKVQSIADEESPLNAMRYKNESLKLLKMESKKFKMEIERLNVELQMRM